MKTITNAEFDELYKEISRFEKDIPGVKYGYDFSEFALAFIGADCFEHWVYRTSELGVMFPLWLGKMTKDHPEAKNDPEQIKDFLLKESPVRDILLKVAYLGYRLGKGMKEEQDK
jgi:hypothetical protein